MKTFAEKQKKVNELFNRIMRFDTIKKVGALSYCYGVLSNFVTDAQIDILEKYVSEQEAEITEAKKLLEHCWDSMFPFAHKEKLETLNDEVRNASSETIAEEL